MSSRHLRKDENKNLSENEKVYVSSVKDLENKLKTSYDDLKSYFFENADKYSNEELKKIYDGSFSDFKVDLAYELQNMMSKGNNKILFQIKKQEILLDSDK